MGILHKSKVIQADATYKLNWPGFPVMVVGTSDMDRKFHPGGIAITIQMNQPMISNFYLMALKN